MKKIFILSLSLLSIIPISLSSTNEYNNSQKAIKKASNQVDSIDDLKESDEEIRAYYQDLEGKDLKGDAFLSALQDILEKNHAKCDYSGTTDRKSSPSWDSYLLADRNFTLSPITDEELDLINSGETYWWSTDQVYCNVLYEPEPYLFDRDYVNKNVDGHKDMVDREHIYPKSYGFNGASGNNDAYKDMIAGCDMHNLHMGEGETNQHIHSNLPYGNVKNKESLGEDNIGYSTLSGEIGSYLGEASSSEYTASEVIEPIDKDKGDIARSIFYMAARYHDYDDNFNNEEYPTPRLLLSDNPTAPEGTHEPQETENTDISYGILSDLLEWNELDSVTNDEEIRNDLVYKYIQGNRNPFIDYPLWADLAFNPETEYHLELSSPNGVSKDSLIVIYDNQKENYESNEEITFNNISFTYKSNGETITIPNNDITLNITNSFTENIVKENYDFTKSLRLDDGYYTLTFTYTVDTLVNASYDIKVGNLNKIVTFNTSNVKDKYNFLLPIDLSSITGTITVGSDSKPITNEEISINLINVETTSKFENNQTLPIGEYELQLSYTDFTNEIHTQIITINSGIVFDTITIAIIVIAVVILLLIIFIPVIRKKIKKKKKKSKSKKNR